MFLSAQKIEKLANRLMKVIDVTIKVGEELLTLLDKANEKSIKLRKLVDLAKELKQKYESD